MGQKLLSLLLLMLLALPAHSRLINWVPYTELMEKSDLVCIVRFSSSHVVDLPLDDPEFATDNHNDYLVLLTKFEVIAHLKGTCAPEIGLVHYQFAPGKGVANGPSFVDFSRPSFPAPRIQSLKQKATPKRSDPKALEYLMFLKRRPDGKYAPTAGQLDLIVSVRRIEELP